MTQAIILTTIVGGQPAGVVVADEPTETALPISGYVALMARKDDYGAYLVSGNEKQIAMLLEVLPGMLVVDDLSSSVKQDIEKDLLAMLNGLVEQGGYHVQFMPGITLAEMLTWFQTNFQIEQYAVLDDVALPGVDPLV